MADLSDNQSASTTKIIGSDNTGVEQTPVQSTSSGGLHTNLRNNAGTEIGTATNPITIDVNNILKSSFSPDPTNIESAVKNLSLDASGRAETHSTVLTDEGSFRDDFSGSALNTTLTGTITFTNSSSDIIGTGTSFTAQLKNGQYIKKTTDAETLYIRIDKIVSDTELFLETNYNGTTATTTGHSSNWTTTTGDGSFSVANSAVTINSGTAADTITLFRDADYGPFTVSFKLAISQRIANQTITIGVQTPVTSPTKRAVFQFTGTDATAVTCISSSSSAASDTQTTATFLPNNLTSASTNLEYAINISNDQISFIINGVVVATHRDHIVGAYDFLQTVFQHTASAVITNTTIVIDWVNFYNINQLEIANNFIGEPLVIAPIAIIENKIGTYGAASLSFTVAANPTDVFTITGSATKVVRIKRIVFGASATNPTSFNFFITKRSTANTGGTSTVLTAVPNDSDDLPATAVVRNYTANPTLGTLVGNVRSYKLVVPQTTPLGGAVNGPINEIAFGNNAGKSIVLRGTSEVLAINMNAATLIGGVIVACIEWTEENT